MNEQKKAILKITMQHIVEQTRYVYIRVVLISGTHNNIVIIKKKELIKKEKNSHTNHILKYRCSLGY